MNAGAPAAAVDTLTDQLGDRRVRRSSSSRTQRDCEGMSGLRAVAVAGVLTLGDQVGPAGAVGVAELPAPLFDAVGEVM